MAPPAATASPDSPASMMPSTVRGPIEGRSKRRSWPGFGALTSTPVPRARGSARCGADRRHARASGRCPRRLRRRSRCGLRDHHRPGRYRTARSRAAPRARARCRRDRAGPGYRPNAPSCTRMLGATSWAPSRRKPCSSSIRAMPCQQMLVAAVEMADRTGQHAQRREIEIAQLAKARPHQRADEDHVAAAFAAREPQKPAELRDVGPMMRIVFHALRIGPAAQREQHGTAATLEQRVGDRERKGAAAADDRDRTRVRWQVGAVMARRPGFFLRPAPVLPAFISGREPPALINAMTFATTGSSANPTLHRLDPLLEMAAHQKQARDRPAADHGYRPANSRAGASQRHSARRARRAGRSQSRTGSRRRQVPVTPRDHRAFADAHELMRGRVAAHEHVILDRRHGRPALRCWQASRYCRPGSRAPTCEPTMKVHLLPTAVTPPSSSVPVFMVTFSRISQSAPITRACRLAAILAPIAAAYRARRTDRSRSGRRSWCDRTAPRGDQAAAARRSRHSGRSRNTARSLAPLPIDRARRNTRGRVDCCDRRTFQALTIIAPTSASATREPCTVASARIPPHHSLSGRSWSRDTRSCRRERPACGILPCRW